MEFSSVICAIGILTICAIIIYVVCRTVDHLFYKKEELMKLSGYEYMIHKAGDEITQVSMSTIKRMNDELQRQFKSMEEG